MTSTLTRRLALTLGLALCAAPAMAAERTAHDFSFTAIEGDPLPMSQFAGKAVLVVNTASRCGFTGQYEGLQALHDEMRDRGLVVLGIPSDSFRQELGSEDEVKKFCEINYGINFPMTEIEPVKGRDAHPLFAWMAEQGSTPSWNFNKFLIDRDGRLVASFGSSTRPDAAALRSKIDAALN